MADFKKLSAVDKVQAASDTANVLIEENGVIKKVPKTAVGGGESTNKGTGFDFVVVKPDGNSVEANLIAGDYNEIFNKIVNQEFVHGAGIRYNNRDGYLYGTQYTDFNFNIDPDDKSIRFRAVSDNSKEFWIYPDNHVEAYDFD